MVFLEDQMLLLMPTNCGKAVKNGDKLHILQFKNIAAAVGECCVICLQFLGVLEY